MSYLVTGGRVISPRDGIDERSDVLIDGGHIETIGQGLSAKGAERVDATGLIVCPGFVDLHAHLREPGREDEETIASGSDAGAAGGFTALCAMPNTQPVADSASIVEKVWALGREAGTLQVVPAGALSVGLEGERMAAYGAMATSAARVKLFTDDGHGVQDAGFARRAMEYLVAFDGIYAEHCEDAGLAAGGHMHEGERSSSLGLRGVPAAAEEIMAARDIDLCRLTGCRLHLLHISTARTVELVRRAKDEGLPVTAEATPHHFALTDELVESYDPNAKVNPPLRTDEDCAAIRAGLADGTIDAIATDHAPHAPEEKELDFASAPPGMIGLETALAITMTELVQPGVLSLDAAIDLLSARPAAILGLDEQGSIAQGRAANVAIFSPDERWTVDPNAFRSKSRNTPFAGREVVGRVRYTFFEGRLVYSGVAE
ncbi:MAG TPA: dihydroorotase [Actinomycetota bacterium]|nr:dihydroorotase [Actinomycetota bacterium]